MRPRPKQVLAPSFPKSIRRKDIFGGRYTVYEHGEIVRNPVAMRGRNNCTRIAARILLKKFIHKQYYHVNINVDGGKSLGLHSVHYLVCAAFHGDAPPKHEVNHKDGNKLNNHADNLEWVTRGGNQRHAVALGLRPLGEEVHLAKLTEKQVREIISMKGSMSQAKIGKIFGVSQTHVGELHRREHWKHLKIA